MDNMEYIENYFSGNNTDEQKLQFEKKILEDASFAEEVAFYISANRVIQQQLHEEKKQRFRELYQEPKVVSIKQPVKRLWRYMAAASIAALIALSWFLFGDKTSPKQLADKYIQQNWQTDLGVTMSNPDSLQIGLQLFNSKRLTEALAMFETLAKKSTANSEAIKYAGIASIRLQDYEKALKYFSMLEADTSLHFNPGKFYKAVTLLERNKNGDKETAKLLLQEVVAKDMEDKSEAVQWLEKF